MPIYKYPVLIKDDFKIEMPMGASVLSVGTQNGNPFIWALVDNNNQEELRSFRLLGTGHPSIGVSAAEYIGTFQLHEDALVFHLFDARKLN